MIHENEVPEGFELLKPLGRGGNAKVGHVRRGVQEYALKLLEDYRNVKSPSYKRFVNEICALRQLHDDEGVICVFDSNLPEHPTKADRPWYTMPVATPIRIALQELPSLRSCVEAVADIANTLVRLKERTVGHRDIKPDNLFQSDGHWVIGDFGLATFPDSIEGVTEQDGRPVGSRQFMAPEMATDAPNASPFPADIWSLSKTLWSLVTGNPRPSYLPFDPSDDGLVAFGVDNPRTHLIDRLLAQATLPIPDDRIPMEDFASELQQWLRLSDKPQTVLDIGDLASRTRTLMRPELKKRKATDASIASATEAIEALRPRIVELRGKLATEYGSRVSETGYVDEVSFEGKGFTFQFCRLNKSDGLGCREAYFSINAASPATYQLRCAVMIQVLPDLEHLLYAQLVTNAKGKIEVFWEAQFTVPHGTSRELASLTELFDSMTLNIRPALVRMNEIIESSVE